MSINEAGFTYAAPLIKAVKNFGFHVRYIKSRSNFTGESHPGPKEIKKQNTDTAKYERHRYEDIMKNIRRLNAT